MRLGQIIEGIWRDARYMCSDDDDGLSFLVVSGRYNHNGINSNAFLWEDG